MKVPLLDPHATGITSFVHIHALGVRSHALRRNFLNPRKTDPTRIKPPPSSDVSRIGAPVNASAEDAEVVVVVPSVEPPGPV